MDGQIRMAARRPWAPVSASALFSSPMPLQLMLLAGSAKLKSKCCPIPVICTLAPYQMPPDVRLLYSKPIMLPFAAHVLSGCDAGYLNG